MTAFILFLAAGEFLKLLQLFILSTLLTLLTECQFTPLCMEVWMENSAVNALLLTLPLLHGRCVFQAELLRNNFLNEVGTGQYR